MSAANSSDTKRIAVIPGDGIGIDVTVEAVKVLKAAAAAGDLPHLDRALAQFEDFCTVTASIRQGIPVELEVYDSTGATWATASKSVGPCPPLKEGWSAPSFF